MTEPEDVPDEKMAREGWARQAQHSRVTTLAPADETALTVLCGKRVLARVWPRAAVGKQYLVTAQGMFPLLGAAWAAEAVPCACRRKVHLLDRAKLVAAVEERRNVPAARKPQVSVTRVARGAG